MTELMGQMDFGDLIGASAKPAPAEPEWGYDEEGHLLADVMGEETRPAPAMEASTAMEAEAKAEKLALEINIIREQTRGVVISAALQIGEKLVAARGLIPHGRWGAWLATNVFYSERKAQELMRLYEEYGKKTIPQAIQALDYTKAVALLGLPEDQREALAERAAEEDMSSRELQAEVARLKEENKAAQIQVEELLIKAEEARMDRAEEAETAKKALIQEREAAERARGEAEAATRTTEALREELSEVKRGRDVLSERARDAVNRANKLAEDLSAAQEALEAAKAEKPEPERVEVVPEDVRKELERLRRGEAEIKLRAAYERLIKEFSDVETLLDALKGEDAAGAAGYAKALKRAAEMMAGRFAAWVG